MTTRIDIEPTGSPGAGAMLQRASEIDPVAWAAPFQDRLAKRRSASVREAKRKLVGEPL